MSGAGHGGGWASRISRPLPYCPRRYKGYWTIAILDIELTYPAGEVVKTGVCARRPRKICRAIVDTGTYLVYGPRR